MYADIWMLLLRSSLETCYMVVVSGFLSFILGIPLGILLCISREGGISENRILNSILGGIINAGRSIPFVILMVAIIPLTRLLSGSSIGTTAAIVPLTIASIPFVARISEGAIIEVPLGLIEVAQSMGATNWQIITRVLIPESMSGLINAITITMVALVSNSAMAGAIGGGGLGDLGIRYGFQRFDVVVVIATVVVLILIVQLIQIAGDYLQQYFYKNH